MPNGFGQRLGPRWVAALKMQIALVWLATPPALAGAAWLANEAVVSREFRASGERFTQTDGRTLYDDLRARADSAAISLDARLDAIELELRETRAILERVEKRLGNL